MIKSIYPVICSKDVARARDFYAALFDMVVVYDADFYVQLQASQDTQTQLGIVEAGHASIPEGFRVAPKGVLASFEVADVAAYHARAEAMGLRIVLGLRDEAFGQRHFIAVDPDGLLVDVIEPIAFAADQSAFIKSERAHC